MTDKKSSPPSLALWLLRHTCRSEYKEALTGDLVERFREGQTRGWFWRQVLIVSTVSALGSIRFRWPLFCYAIAGTIAMGFSSYLNPLSTPLHCSALPWPWSELVFELIGPAIVASTSVSILAIGLVIARSFRWAYLVRTWIISLLLIAIGHFSVDMFPGLLRSIPGDPYHKSLIVPFSAQILLAFLIAGWLGCPMAAHAKRSEGPTAELQ